MLIDQKSTKNPRLAAQWFEQYQVHTCYATPSFLKLMLRHGRLHKFDFSKLKNVLFAGEVFDIQSLRELKSMWKQAAFFNLYGPTETNVVTYFPIPDIIANEQEYPFPIGKLCAGATAKLWDGNTFLTMKGEGELAISGPSVTPGYLGLADKMDKSFVKDQDGETYYLTGDWVGIDENGNLIFKGRKDRMVKRRGYRIELAELERALSAHDIIAEVACLAYEAKIIAFCATYRGTKLPDHIELNQFLLAYLPAYMLPDRYLHVDELPQTSTQKTDYQSFIKFVA